MSLVRQAVDTYHRILGRKATGAQELLDELYEQQEQKRMMYSDRPIRTMLRPNFISPEQMDKLAYTAQVLSNCLERVVKLYSESEDVRRQIPFSPVEEELFKIPTGLKRNVVISRHDSFFAAERLTYIEFNTDSPASAFYNTVHQSIFRELPVMQELEREFVIDYNDSAAFFFAAMMDSYKEFGLNEEPRLILTDWNDVSTMPEFELAVEYFESRGVACRIADPRELEFKDGAIWAGDFRANFVNRRVLLREMTEKLDECQALVEAARSGKVCIVNPFNSKIVGSKAAVAFLSDERNRHHFTPEEHRLIDDHLPWSSVLKHEPVRFRGRQWDPFEVAAKYRDIMVLKPLNDHGGRGVRIGGETDETQWNQALTHAEDGGWSIQEMVTIPEELFPVLNPDLKFEPRKININPFALGGRYGGCLTRVSASSIINVSTGGGIVPTFIVTGAR